MSLHNFTFRKKIIITCPNLNCQQKLRLPKTRSTLKVTCPKCSTTFYYTYPYGIGKRKTKWYHQKWFVILLLFIFPPAGIILLWSGSKFGISTRIGLSIAFGLLFIVQSINYINYYHYYPVFKKAPLTQDIYLPRKTITPLEIITNVSKEKDKILTIPQIVKETSPAVVCIESIDRSGNTIGKASGFIINENGLIVTNYHVLGGAYSARIKLEQNEIYKNVFIVKADKQKDIALIKIEGENLPTITLGDSDKIEIGEKVVAIGNPLGYERSVSDGLISGVREKKGMKYIQTTAPISPGSSGGPVLNMHGEVVGVTTSGYFVVAQNLNFAVPINYVKSLMNY